MEKKTADDERLFWSIRHGNEKVIYWEQFNDEKDECVVRNQFFILKWKNAHDNHSCSSGRIECHFHYSFAESGILLFSLVMSRSSFFPSSSLNYRLSRREYIKSDGRTISKQHISLMILTESKVKNNQIECMPWTHYCRNIWGKKNLFWFVSESGTFLRIELTQMFDKN